MSDSVNHPAHYQAGAQGEYETIKVLQAWLTPEQFHGFCLGNALKYLSRAWKKTADPIEDLKKARWYLDCLLADLYASKPVLQGSGRADPGPHNGCLIYSTMAEAQHVADEFSTRLNEPFTIRAQGDGWKVVRA